MIFIRILGVTIGTETFATGVIVMINLAPPPVAVTLNAKMIITFTCQFAITCPTLQQPLSQRDTSGNLMLLHLLHSKWGILLDVFIIARISALCMCRNGKTKQYYNNSQSEEDTFHVSNVEFDTKVRKRIEKTNPLIIF